jgi:hypothetical protein
MIKQGFTRSTIDGGGSNMLRQLLDLLGFATVARAVKLVACFGAVFGGTAVTWALPGTINLSLAGGRRYRQL